MLQHETSLADDTGRILLDRKSNYRQIALRARRLGLVPPAAAIIGSNQQPEDDRSHLISLPHVTMKADRP